MSRPDPSPKSPDSEELLLRKRARALAAPEVRGRDVTQAGEILVVAVGQARYAMPLRLLSAVVPLTRLTRLPGAPRTVAGLAQVHGNTVTVVHLGELLEQPAGAPRAAVLIERAGETLALGVSGYEGVEPAWKDQLQPMPGNVPSRARRYLEGVGPGGVARLDLERLLEDLLSGEEPGPGSGS